MEFGGMTGEEKSEIYKLMPKESYPKTLLINDKNRDELKEMAISIGFPLIAKPNIGERGQGVEIIRSLQGLIRYSDTITVDFLLQELVTYPVELGVFYVRQPDQEHGRVTSIVMKKFLSVTGDGTSSVRNLLSSEKRAQLQLDIDNPRFSHIMDKIPSDGENVIVEPIGNHCRGTMFLDATHEVDKELNRAIDDVAKQIDGFYYGRFDLKCASIDDLRHLRNYKVVELNGTGAEPGHIYQPGFPLLKAYRIVMWHFSQMAVIARKNKKMGVTYWTFRRGVKKMLDIRSYNRRLSPS